MYSFGSCDYYVIDLQSHMVQSITKLQSRYLLSLRLAVKIFYLANYLNPENLLYGIFPQNTIYNF